TIGLRDEARLRLGLGGGILTILIGGVMDSYLQVQIAFLFWVMMGLIIVLLKEPVENTLLKTVTVAPSRE
ncbi:MAG: hypothetical protein ACK4OO_03415, partial [bacterium]